MKKIALFILAIIYFAVSSGVVINLHYCMDRFASADFGLTNSGRFCDKCNMPKKQGNNCCHDQVKLIKLHADQHKAGFSFRLSSLEKMLVKTQVFNFSLSCDNAVTNKNLAHSPPLPNRQDTYLRNCVFRI
jgi:hypothetical protein